MWVNLSPLRHSSLYFTTLSILTPPLPSDSFIIINTFSFLTVLDWLTDTHTSVVGKAIGIKEDPTELNRQNRTEQNNPWCVYLWFVSTGNHKETHTKKARRIPAVSGCSQRSKKETHHESHVEVKGRKDKTKNTRSRRRKSTRKVKRSQSQERKTSSREMMWNRREGSREMSSPTVTR